MPHLIPPQPNFANEAERKVWDALNSQLPDACFLLHSVRVTDRSEDREADLVVIWPNKGIAFMEVKGGYIVPNADGTFQQGIDHHEIDPVDQINKARYVIREWISKRTSLTYFPPNEILVSFPETVLSRSYAHPEIGRYQIIDKDDLIHAADIVRRNIEANSGKAIAPSFEDCERFAVALQATTKDVTNIEELASIIDERTQQVDEYLKENEKLLEFVSDLNRFHVRGPAGSGKTALALAQARRLKLQGKKVAFLCYSRALAMYIRHTVEKWPKSERIDVVRTFHSLATEFGVSVPANAGEEFWTIESIRQFQKNVEKSPESAKFDAVIVDEAQDFGQHWWDVVEALLQSHGETGAFAFGDSSQEIFGHAEGYEIPYPPLRLTLNLRNSDPIAQVADLVTGTHTPTVGISGPEVRFVTVPDDAQENDFINTADDVVEYLREYYLPQHIALLTTKHRHPVHRELAAISKDHHLRSLWDTDEIFYGTVSGFKGLERNCVVLVINGFFDDANRQDLIYTGLTRARDLLVIVSADKFINQYFSGEHTPLRD